MLSRAETNGLRDAGPVFAGVRESPSLRPHVLGEEEEYRTARIILNKTNRREDRGEDEMGELGGEEVDSLLDREVELVTPPRIPLPLMASSTSRRIGHGLKQHFKRLSIPYVQAIRQQQQSPLQQEQDQKLRERNRDVRRYLPLSKELREKFGDDGQDEGEEEACESWEKDQSGQMDTSRVESEVNGENPWPGPPIQTVRAARRSTQPERGTEIRSRTRTGSPERRWSLALFKGVAGTGKGRRKESWRPRSDGGAGEVEGRPFVARRRGEGADFRDGEEMDLGAKTRVYPGDEDSGSVASYRVAGGSQLRVTNPDNV
ncbi:hypothetical protein BGW38_009426 [Lunasporangiospora selenospora]|uniref:Uncharacterized protein n=1 Tax=Lunasporangiospora selenospora TaxID=979761 RepID=A0A9P6FXQ4_9FUNG|nr:hypothetical protein BGW38_009426 [Lunasporangiospora selenospora]